MARPRSLTDSEIIDHVLNALADGGEKAVSFGLISQRSGLAPATLAQRFGTVDAMLRVALVTEWARLAEAITAAESGAIISSKGAQALLKQLPAPSMQVLLLSLRHEETRQAAEAWRILVEEAIAIRRGGGTKGRDAAVLIFAAWQGRQMWADAGGKSFRLADMLKALP